jgi:hypothetical protein
MIPHWLWFLCGFLIAAAPVSPWCWRWYVAWGQRRRHAREKAARVDFGLKLRRARTGANLSAHALQKMLNRLSNLSTIYVESAEQGRDKLKPDEVKRWMIACGEADEP